MKGSSANSKRRGLEMDDDDLEQQHGVASHHDNYQSSGDEMSD